MKTIPGFLGHLNLRQDGDEIPVFGVWTRLDGNAACALDMKAGISWDQYCPADNQAEKESQEGFFYVRVLDLARDEASGDKIIAEDAPWLRDKGDKQRYLSLRVWLQIFERFRISVPKSRVGFRFTVAEEEPVPKPC